MRARLLIAAALILTIGLLAATAVYLTAADEAIATSYLIVGGEAYAVDPTRSKSYQLQVERFGGKAAILFDEFNRWFAARWEGKAPAARRDDQVQVTATFVMLDPALVPLPFATVQVWPTGCVATTML